MNNVIPFLTILHFFLFSSLYSNAFTSISIDATGELSNVEVILELEYPIKNKELFKGNLDENGKLKIELSNVNSGLYFLKIGKLFFNVYLEPDNLCVLKLLENGVVEYASSDPNHFINHYLHDSRELINNFKYEGTGMWEIKSDSSFVVALDYLLFKKDSLLNSYLEVEHFDPKALKLLRARNENIVLQFKLIRTGSKLPEVSKSLFGIENKVRFDPENLFIGSINYLSLLNAYLSNFKDKAFIRSYGNFENFQKQHQDESSMRHAFFEFNYNKIKELDVEPLFKSYFKAYQIQNDIFDANLFKEFLHLFNQEYPNSPFLPELEAKLEEISSLNGAEMPSIVGEDIEGNKVDLKEFKGKVIFIDFWATWCGPCIKEFKHYPEILKKYKNEEIVFIFLSVDDERDKWQEFLSNGKGPESIHLNIPQSQYSVISKQLNYEGTGIPQFLLIDKDGKIIKTHSPRPSETKSFEEQINKALGI
ncbi:Thiol-disulfide isomerase or thioredoxin [Spirosomataceae bacterium TFI 002]|nr:Thiol-disulfide isomerase or thioredoxin [Spirosomataceae bacterium TFI 002]